MFTFVEHVQTVPVFVKSIAFLDAYGTGGTRKTKKTKGFTRSAKSNKNYFVAIYVK